MVTGVVVYAGLCSAAVAAAPKYKVAFMAASMVPTALFQAANITYDAPIVACILLGTALLLREIHTPDKRLEGRNGPRGGAEGVLAELLDVLIFPGNDVNNTGDLPCLGGVHLLDESVCIGAAKELRMEHVGHDVVNTELSDTGSQRIGKLTGQIGFTDYSEMFSLTVYAYYISHLLPLLPTFFLPPQR